MSWYLFDPSPSYHAQASWAETDPRCHHLLLSHQLLGFSAGFGLAMDQYGMADVSIEGGGTYSFFYSVLPMGCVFPAFMHDHTSS